MESISWKLYDKKHDLSGILTLAARSCVDSRALRPIEYLAAYFSAKCTGDEIRCFSGKAMFTTGGASAIRVVIQLLNGMEEQSSAVLLACSETGDGFDLPAPDGPTVCGILDAHFFPRLVACRARDQHGFDETLSGLDAASHIPKVGTTVLHALSIVASAVASRCTSTPLFQYIRDTYNPPTSSEYFAMPQLCIDFFGPENMVGARVAIKSVLLLPSMPNGSVSHEVMQKIFAAFHHFRKTHNTGIRSDGSLVFSNYDNITDAIHIAEESLKVVGLTPVVDVCVGLQLAAAATKTQKDVKDGGEVFYALFPSDVDVSGSQLAEYVRGQVQLHSGFVTYVEDTHHDIDTIGLRRLHAAIGGDVVVSGFDLYQQSRYAKMQQGLDEMWTSNVVLEPCTVGTLSAFYDTMRLVQSHQGCTVGIAPQHLMHNIHFTMNLAVGTGARFVCVGGLMDAVQCEVVSRYMCVQSELAQMNVLLKEAPMPPCAELPEVPMDAVPEIKRRLDKKKRKK